MILEEMKKDFKINNLNITHYITSILWPILTTFMIILQFLPYSGLDLNISGMNIGFYIFTGITVFTIFGNQAMHANKIIQEKYLGLIESIVIAPISNIKYAATRSISNLASNFWVIFLYIAVTINVYQLDLGTVMLTVLIMIGTAINWGILLNIISIGVRDPSIFFILMNGPVELVANVKVPSHYLPSYLAILGWIYPQFYLLILLRNLLMNNSFNSWFIALFSNLIIFLLSIVVNKYFEAKNDSWTVY